MSHFSVLVVGKNWDEQLMPYDEQTTEPEYLEFNDREDELREDYENKTVERIVYEDKLLAPYDEIFRVKGEFGYGNNSHKVPDNLERREVSFKEIYNTFEEFAKDHHGYSKDDKENGRYGYTHNPNAKWDWYQLGGRWSGFLKLKEGRTGRLGEKSWMVKDEIKQGYVDQACIKDIDFEGMISIAKNNAKNTYESIEKIFRGNIPKLEFYWDTLINDEKYSKLSIKEKGDLYRNQQATKIWNITLKNKEHEKYFWMDIEEFQCSKEEYIKKAEDKALTTFAVLKENKWYEKGEMGWWGAVSNEKNQDNWNAEFKKLLESISDNELISIVDCHI